MGMGLMTDDRAPLNPMGTIARDDPQETGLTQLLKGALPPQRCIDRVAEHLADIIEARRRKITWDAIALSMSMNRGTLINAVTTLTRPCPLRIYQDHYQC